jgi:hypothetical protein
MGTPWNAREGAKNGEVVGQSKKCGKDEGVMEVPIKECSCVAKKIGVDQFACKASYKACPMQVGLGENMVGLMMDNRHGDEPNPKTNLQQSSVTKTVISMANLVKVSLMASKINAV